MLTKDEIFNKALHACMEELYFRAQPSEDWNKILKDAEEGKIKKDEHIYDRYYISQEEYKYVVDKYVNAYNLEKKWDEYVDVVIKYIEKGGTKDKYIDSYTDDNGNYHPGHRGYEKVLPINKQIKNYLETNISDEYIGNIDVLSNDIAKLVLNNIKECKDFYRFDRDEDDFRCAIALSLPSPSFNKQTVIDYWKSQNIDIDIKERNPLLFWDEDYYGDELDEVMTYEYGENWREKFDKEWEEEKRKKKEESEKKIKELEKQIEYLKKEQETENE